MRALLPWVFLLMASVAAADDSPWIFGPPEDVTHSQGTAVFHHLESSGRKNVAVSGKWVAVVWEDNRDGKARCYAAFKQVGRNSGFENEVRISGADEAFEPVVVSLEDGNFAVAWEENGSVWTRVLGVQTGGPPTRLSSQEAAQVNLGFGREKGLFATWAEQDGGYASVRLARLSYRGPKRGLLAGSVVVIDQGQLKGDQAYPSVAVMAHAVVVAWEDRRHGHTLIFHGMSADGRHFGPATQLNETRHVGQSAGVGRGTGVMRVALSPYQADGVAAVWADKRDFLSGYDVYAGLSLDGGKSFGPNEKVQDSLGDAIAQWHPAIAANRQGTLAVVWDDDRDGTPDVWLSWRNQDGWSDDVPIPGASGPGVQSDPSITLDGAGNLHAVWIDKPDLNSPTRIRYSMGRAR
jgi:hypothetical protein